MGDYSYNKRGNLMTSILFVCLANQFRSPLAAAIFSKILAEKGLDKKIVVGSAGTWVKEACRAHNNAIQIAEKNGLDLTTHISREINNTLIDEANLIIVMEKGQKEALSFEFANSSKKILMLSELSSGNSLDIPDPSDENFVNSEQVFQLLTEEINKAFEKIISMQNIS